MNPGVYVVLLPYWESADINWLGLSAAGIAALAFAYGVRWWHYRDYRRRKDEEQS